MKLKFTLAFVLSLSSLCAFCQYENLSDSLIHCLRIIKNSPQDDSLRLQEYQITMNLGNYFRFENSDSAFFWYDSVVNLEQEDAILENIEKSKIVSTAHRRIGAIYLDYSNFTEAEASFRKSLYFAEKAEDQGLQAAALANLGLALQYQGLYEDGIVYYKQALEIDRSLKDSVSISYDLNNIANAYMYSNDYQTSIFYYEEALELAYAGLDSSQIAICLNNLGNVYMYQADYKSASETFFHSLEIVRKLEDYETIAYNLISLGNVNESVDNYPQALKYFEEALEICTELGNIIQICQCYSGMGNIAEKQGNYKKAIELQHIAMSNFKLIDDKLGVSYCLNNIAISKIKLRELDSARIYIEESMKLKNELSEYSGTSNCLFNLGTIATYQNNYEEANEYFKKSMEISEEIGEIQGVSKCLNNIGSLRMLTGQFDEARDYFLAAYKIDFESGSKAALADYSNTLAQAYIKLGDFEKAKPVLLTSVEYTRDLLRENFAIMSESEKEMYLKQAQLMFDSFNNFVLIYPGEKTELYKICYNNELLIKGLLLNSNIAMANAINNSDDAELKNAFLYLKQVRDEISYAQTMNFDGKVEYISALESEAEKTEKLLVEKSSGFAEFQQIFNINWDDISKTLLPGDAAIEFIAIQHRNNNYFEPEKDSTSYAALIVKSDSRTPEFVPLCYDSELSLLKQKTANSINYINDLYRGVILSSVNNQSEIPDLYKLIWEPMNDNLKGVKNIYYAPTGILHRISFAAVKDNNDRYISDIYNLNNLSCTKVLVNNSKIITKNSAVLFGGVNYDFTSDHIKEVSTFYNNAEVKENLLKTNHSTGIWAFLPGTLNETINIDKILKKGKYDIEIYTANQATEEKIKRLSDYQSPYILHIATHGFSIPSDANNAYSVFDNSFVKNNNPLYRTGLLFSGANRIWNGSSPIQGTEDGILTAFEVSLLDLQNTGLVVLSACETGLGDIRGNEGVYGFQRAFKMAGAEYLILSLWQVPDKETEEFMSMFYKNLVKSNDIALAFNKTQQYMRKNYDPFYWAAFILLK